MSTPDFDKLFGTNAPSTPFTWSDSDYLQGWASIENTPPSRQQFDALQRLSDEKSKWLNDNKCDLDSPAFTGDPTAPTPPWNDADTSLATTEFVKHWIDVVMNQMPSGDWAPINSPTFTGDPKAPTPGWDDNDTSLATTEFVQHWKQYILGQLGDNGVGIVESLVAMHGYVVFKNGFIIQWAMVTTGSDGHGSGNFPLTFPNGVRGVYVTGDEASQEDFHKLQHAASTSNSSYEITSYDLINTQGVADTMWIMAIGY